jgi:hypothetical protein
MVVIGSYRTHAELRRHRRKQINYSASIISADGSPPRRCALRDVSESGARLIFETDEATPDEFILLLSANGSTRRHGRAVWRAELEMGVTFLREAPHKPTRATRSHGLI